jgi:hypothetical protein
VKDPDELLLPSGNLVLIALREKESGDRVAFTLLDDFPKDIRHGSAIETSNERIHPACTLLVYLT